MRRDGSNQGCGSSSLARACLSLFLLLGVGVLTGCKTLRGSGELDYAGDAKTNLERGNEAFASRNYADAEKYFDYVRTKYPYLDAAKEAELRLGDTDFAKDQFTEARDRYTNFAKLHPTHPKADYAAFQGALTHYKEMPSDFFLLPPAYEKDQTEIRAAAKAMDDFLHSYPNSSFAPEGKKILDEVRHKLAQHEVYAADFYAHRNRWRAVAARLEAVVQKYPGIGFDQDALFRLHDVYLKLNDREKARDALKRVVERFPGTDAAAKAQRILSES